MSQNISSEPVVIRGGADPDEIAAVLAVLDLFSSLSRPVDETGTPPSSGTWTDRARLIGGPARPGPAGWISSGRPR